jgi:malate dehydrogenase (oxaloacetate-decarboxylating)(NADP+)
MHRLYVALGIKKENVVMVDSKGVINNKRTDLNKYKKEWITDRDISTLAEAVKDADVFLGLSVANMLSKEMLSTMAPNPIVFAMANPNPEISYEDAMATRDDLIFATGRSDYPNQINNVLGFPFIFRGALDVRARTINEEMKLAATKALAGLAKEKVPEEVLEAYELESLEFGREYIIPKPLDPRLISRVAPAVARAAIETGVARPEDGGLGRLREFTQQPDISAHQKDSRHLLPQPALENKASSLKFYAQLRFIQCHNQ